MRRVGSGENSATKCNGSVSGGASVLASRLVSSLAPPDCLHVDRVAGGDRDYLDSRQFVIAGAKQSEGQSPDGPVRFQLASVGNYPGAVHLGQSGAVSLFWPPLATNALRGSMETV